MIGELKEARKVIDAAISERLSHVTVTRSCLVSKKRDLQEQEDDTTSDAGVKNIEVLNSLLTWSGP